MLCAALLALHVIGCEQDSASVAVERVTLDMTELTLTRGETARLTAAVMPENADDKTVTWHSPDTSIATVGNDGTVTAVNVGTATITAWASGFTATCAITVKLNVHSITLEPEFLSLIVGTTENLATSVDWLGNPGDWPVAYWSSDTSVATVEDYGSITAHSVGTATIYAQAGDKTATCEVTVKPKPVIAVERVTLNMVILTIETGRTYTLTAEVLPNDADDKAVTWRSSDTSIATVDNNGTVTAHKAGKATIYARAGDKTAICALTVPPMPVASITLEPETLTLKTGMTGTLAAKVLPDDADGTTVLWSSSNTSIATVDNNGTVTAVKEGSVTITARAGDITAECTVNVKQTLIAAENIMLNKASLTLMRGKTEKLTATVAPSNADDTTVVWSSSDTAVATVGSDGTVTAVKVGTATITAEADGRRASCTVTVNPICVTSVTLNTTTLTLERGKTGELTATVTPSNADNTTVTWSSSDTSIATVDNNGTVTAVKAGTANITAEADGRTATCTVTVKFLIMAYGTIDDNGVLTKYSGSETTVVIPDGVTGIGNEAFRDCTSLKGVTIPDSVTSIGYNAFLGCTSLTDVTIGSGVTSIGSEAFKNCTSLKGVTIPDSVTTIGSSAFKGCESLASVTIGSSVITIGVCAFEDCTSLKGVTIPDSVTTIGGDAFQDCSGLTSVTIGSSVISIDACAFSKCTSLTGVTIPSRVRGIGNSAFRWCTSLTSVTIPTSVTTIGSSAFSDCGSLKTVQYDGTEVEWEKIQGISESGLADKTITFTKQ